MATMGEKPMERKDGQCMRTVWSLARPLAGTMVAGAGGEQISHSSFSVRAGFNLAEIQRLEGSLRYGTCVRA